MSEESVTALITIAGVVIFFVGMYRIMGTRAAIKDIEQKISDMDQMNNIIGRNR